MNKKILIVDDTITNRLMLGNILKHKYDIMEASDGTEALNILDRHYQSISAVLLDIVMPGINGFEVLNRIRASNNYSQIPIIIVTGDDSQDNRVKALAMGANDFIMKPYVPEIIHHSLKNCITLSEASARVLALQRDRLTGLFTRESFFDRVQEMVASQEAGYYVMSSFDVSKFKVINDQYGTEKGDEVLRHIAHVLMEGFNPYGGICSRIAADNFAVMFPCSLLNDKMLDEITTRASHIKGLASSLIFYIGRYRIIDKTLSPYAMYDRATLAATTIKGKYGVKCAVYNEQMRSHLIAEQNIVLEMEDALAKGQFELWFQPQFNHTTDGIIGAEALVRWNHPQNGIISPNSFISIFEENGFIYALDKFIWEEVCRYLRKWIDEDCNPLPISVNISRYDLFQPDIIHIIKSMVNKYNLPVGLLRLEITESAFSESTEHIVHVIKELLACGFTVEIDDFGSGYSSLNTLKDVPAQIIKLDMKFLESNDDSNRGGSIVESVVRMAKWLDMTVIAEGVETIEQANFLRSIGCHYMQGYLFARPMPLDKYESYTKSSIKEEQLLTLETFENMDNNSFWDPKSMDSLIFNSYVGCACIFEYHNDKIELLRGSKRYIQLLSNAGLDIDVALKLDWMKYLDREAIGRIYADLRESAATRSEITNEYTFHSLPGCKDEINMRSTLRVIASTGERLLVYCLNENITAQRMAEKKIRQAKEKEVEMEKALMDNLPVGAGIYELKDGQMDMTYQNKSYWDLVGLKDEKYLGNGPMSAIFPDDIPHVMGELSSAIEEKRDVSCNVRLRHLTLGYRPVHLMGRVIFNDDGSFLIYATFSPMDFFERQ